MIRVLQSVSAMDRAGIETMLMNYYRHFDRSQVQFDFLVNKNKHGDYDEEILSMGGRIFYAPGLAPHQYPRYLKFMAKLLHDEPEICILHAHNEAMAFYALRGAMKAGLPVRIAHAHNTRIIRDYKYPLKMACKAVLPFAATAYCACGTDSGIYYFGRQRWEQQGRLIHNAIETERFRFQPEVRAQIRKQQGLDGHLVIGHVGRLNVQKNHKRLLTIFAQLLKIRPDAVLLLLGGGELEQPLKEQAAALGIAGKVRFLGVCSNVSEWMQAMDIFVMPSLFEGLPVVGVEAQTAGLPCLFSDAVTKEVLLSPDSRRLSLKQSDEIWAQTIAEMAQASHARENGVGYAVTAGYDIAVEAKKLQEWYLSLAQHHPRG